MRDENNEDFFCEGFYHTILFVIVYVVLLRSLKIKRALSELRIS